MQALNRETPAGLGSVVEGIGLELLEDRQLLELAGGTMFVAALWVMGGIGGALAVGVILGACLYIFTQ
jgi:hypothetical protein